MTEIEGSSELSTIVSAIVSTDIDLLLRLWLQGFRQCHLRDGAALVRYFAWLEERLNEGAELTESQVADQLERYRS